MSRILKNRMAFLIGLVFVLQVLSLAAVSPTVLAADKSEIELGLNKTVAYCSSNIVNFNDNNGDWVRLGLAWAGENKVYADGHSGEPLNASDYARKIISGISVREDSSSYVNTLQEMQKDDGSFESPDGTTTLNQTIWPVIALDMAKINGYSVNYNTDEAVNYIVYHQDTTGGFDESGYGVDIDSTAHALIALAPYTGKPEVKNAIDNAITYLQANQHDSGAFLSWGAPNSDSTAAVIEALIALNKPLLGDDWKGDMVKAMFSYQKPDGSFFYSASYSDPSVMSTYHALLALSDAVKGKSKYQNNFNSNEDIYLEIDSPASFALNSDARIDVVLNNRHSSSAEALLIWALYAKNVPEKMISYTCLHKVLSAGEKCSADSSFTIPASGNYEIRVYLWDNWEDKNALMCPTVISVN